MLAGLRVHHRLHAALAALGRVVELHLPVRADRDVRLAHRGEPERLVLDRVLLRADAEEAAVEQPHRAREHARAREAVSVEVGLHVLAQVRQRACEPDHLGRTSPRRAGRATARGRGTACGRPRRCRWPGGDRAGDGQIQTSFHAGGIPSSRMRASILRIVHPAPVLVVVLEAPAAPAAGDPGARAVGSAEPCHVPHSLPACRRFRLGRGDGQPRLRNHAERDRRRDRPDGRARPLGRRPARGRARPPGRPSPS